MAHTVQLCSWLLLNEVYSTLFRLILPCKVQYVRSMKQSNARHSRTLERWHWPMTESNARHSRRWHWSIAESNVRLSLTHGRIECLGLQCSHWLMDKSNARHSCIHEEGATGRWSDSVSGIPLNGLDEFTYVWWANKLDIKCQLLSNRQRVPGIRFCHGSIPTLKSPGVPGIRLYHGSMSTPQHQTVSAWYTTFVYANSLNRSTNGSVTD